MRKVVLSAVTPGLAKYSMPNVYSVCILPIGTPRPIFVNHALTGVPNGILLSGCNHATLLVRR